MDVRFAMPVYRDGKIFCWLSNTGHWPDIGGAVPGGFSASATAVEQEGLRLPPVKLFKKGGLDPEIHAIIASNIRVADQRIGDIKAQAAALMVGAGPAVRNPRPLRRRHRRARRSPSCAQRAAEQMRAEHRRNPRRRLSLAGPIVDSDGVVDDAADHRACRHQAEATGSTFDFAGSSPPCAGPMNSVLRDDPVLGLPRHAPHLPRRADQRRRLRAADRQASGGHASSTPNIRGRSRAARRRSRSASPRPCSPPWCRRCPTR